MIKFSLTLFLMMLIPSIYGMPANSRLDYNWTLLGMLKKDSKEIGIAV